VGRCVELVRKGGRVAAIGIPLDTATIPMRRLVLDEIELVGVRANAGEMPEAIALVAAGRIPLRELITHRFTLEDFADAYRVFTERVDGALKVIVRP
jgi:L-iditol 2-dehydrogenase